jgi:SulP family sulfate permease
MKRGSFLPIASWLPAYRRKYLIADLQAGLTVGVMLIPQGMAYALLAGMPPIYGLYASLLPLFLYALFGSSMHLSVGPTALVSLLVFTGLAPLAEAGSPAYVSMAIAVGLMAGFVQVLLGLFRLGFLVNFLSHPVLSGFTSAAAFIIGFSQLKHLLGLSITTSGRIHELLPQFWASRGDISWTTLLVGLGSIALMVGLRRWRRSLPAALLTVLLGIGVAWVGHLDARAGLAIVGEVPRGLPPLDWPRLDMESAGRLLPLALTITLISFIESLAIAKAIQRRHGHYAIRPNQELLALGISKIGGALFSAFPTTGSFTRSAVNEQAGAKTTLSSIVAALLLGATLLFFTPLFYFLPKAVLAAIIMMAVVSLVDVGEMRYLWRTDRRDFLTFAVTFGATLLLGIQLGILVGVVLSLALMIYRQSKPNIAVLGRLPGTTYYRNISRFEQAEQHDELLIVRFDAPLYFGNAAFFKERLLRLLDRETRHLGMLVLDASAMPDMDSTGAKAMSDVLNYVQERRLRFALSGATGPVRDLLKRHGLMEAIGRDNQFLYIQDAVADYRQEASDSRHDPTQTNI